MSSPAEAYGTFEPSNPQQQRGNRWKKAIYSTGGRVVGLAALLLIVVGGFLLFQSPSPSTANGTSTGNDVAVLTASERTFIDGVQPEKLREFLHAYASVPHTCGTEQDYQTAVYTAQQFAAFGLQAEIKEYYTLLSYPVHRRLAIVAPQQNALELNLTEASVPGDACTTDPNALPPFLAYSASGNVTASVVYANYGTQEDFECLASNNVTLKGKIALVRYGRNFRGLKVMAGEQYGVAGVLIYSDPQQDGFTQGPVYPEGIYRPKGSFQRGSLQYLSLASGDPLTPGWASVPGAPYLKYEDVKTIPHVPALPLSYEQADLILRSLGGQKAPATWQGGLTYPGGYRLGDDEALVLNLDVVMDNKVGPIWDVIGTIEGAVEPDQQVLIGNHRDAWVCGAVDPSSGSAVMLEIARGLGELLQQGWKPRRSIVLGSWDGEEYGLLGSTEFAEERAEQLKKEAVAYINVDNVVGPLVLASGTPSIAKFLEDTAKVVPPNTFFGKDSDRNEPGNSLYDQWVAQTQRHRSKIYGVYDGTLAPDHLIQFMGSGSDFTAFYQHLGVISANLGFTLNGAVYGTYHSNMDSLMYMETLGDPNYETHASMAQWWGLLTMRLASDVVVPFDFTTYALVMQEDLAGLEQQLADMNRSVNFTELHAAIARFGANADQFHAHVKQFEATTNSSDEALLRHWNEKLVLLERHLITEAGLPHRPWYKHVIFGPGFYEGYMGAAFPGISDCVAFRDDSAAVQTHVDEVARIVDGAAAYLVASRLETQSISQQEREEEERGGRRSIMMPLSTPTGSSGGRRDVHSDPSTLADGAEAYGTFQDRAAVATSRKTRVPLKLWRFLGAAALLVFAASYMLLQSWPQPSSGHVRGINSSQEPVIAAPEAVTKVEFQEEETETLSHKHADEKLSKLEKKFLKNVDTPQIRAYHAAYASVPHPAGSAQDYATALYTAEQFESFGINAEIIEYYPLLSLPLHRRVAIVSPLDAARELNLTEATVPGDACTSNEDALPPYLGYSDSGNVTAPVVYVNFATPADFQWLKASNVTLEGKIALVRYGGNFRGLKVMLAEQHGMAGVLIYSDPMEDGYAQGPYNSISGGDPLTPGFPSLPGEPYLSTEDCKTIPHIPTLPLSYGQARFILESLGGKKAPNSWQGALELGNGGYYVGDDDATVLNLDVAMDNSIGPIWDVIGTIEGSEEPDQMVLIGNHRDAWVCGAVDPSSGSAVMLEIARGLGELLKDGWKPRRTLVIAS
ncbi:hypothetical protein BBJ28_00024180, partial [Nothophytophthora sp. Chile5]